jgi:hypothetical protein
MRIPLVSMALLVLLALLAAGMTSGCATTGSAPSPVVAGVERCTGEAVQQAAANLVDDVATAAASGNYLGALGALAGRFGLAEVECAAQMFLGLHARSAGQDPALDLQNARVRQWLAKQPAPGPGAGGS